MDLRNRDVLQSSTPSQTARSSLSAALRPRTASPTVGVRRRLVMFFQVRFRFCQSTQHGSQASLGTGEVAFCIADIRLFGAHMTLFFLELVLLRVARGLPLCQPPPRVGELRFRVGQLVLGPEDSAGWARTIGEGRDT